MTKNFFRPYLISGLAIGICTVAIAASLEDRIEATALRTLQLNHSPGLVIIDVRSPADFAKGHIQGADSIPSSAIQNAGLKRVGMIVVYCGEDPCPLTSGAYSRLSSDGYKQVYILSGGLPAWFAKGYPIVTGQNLNAAHQGHRKDTASQEGRKLQDGSAIAIDVGSPYQFHASHLPGAINSPLETLGVDAPRLPKDKELVIYDRQPARAKKAVKVLTAAGLHASELPGGLAGWAKRRQPLEVK